MRGPWRPPCSRRQRVAVVEFCDGTVQARHGGKLPPLTRFGKDDAEITQGASVSNKLLAGALQFIKDKQAEKDLEKLAKLRTKREGPEPPWRLHRRDLPASIRAISAPCCCRLCPGGAFAPAVPGTRRKPHLLGRNRR
jgi:hypothetical protein